MKFLKSSLCMVDSSEGVDWNSQQCRRENLSLERGLGNETQLEQRKPSHLFYLKFINITRVVVINKRNGNNNCISN